MCANATSFVLITVRAWSLADSFPRSRFWNNCWLLSANQSCKAHAKCFIQLKAVDHFSPSYLGHCCQACKLNSSGFSNTAGFNDMTILVFGHTWLCHLHFRQWWLYCPALYISSRFCWFWQTCLPLLHFKIQMCFQIFPSKSLVTLLKTPLDLQFLSQQYCCW